MRASILLVWIWQTFCSFNLLVLWLNWWASSKVVSIRDQETSHPSHTKILFPTHFRLIRCNLKSKIPDSTFSDAIACMFCMAVWIKDWLSLLLSCSNLCPLSLQGGSGEFPKQSGLTFPGRYGLPHSTLKNARPGRI